MYCHSAETFCKTRKGMAIVMRITAKANAKINLFLDISSKRNDGYHNLVSIMQSVDLCDVITVDYTGSNSLDISVSCDNSNVPLGNDNLVYHAAGALIDRGLVRISIEKRIPMSAGLAGGSADAAATLVALNRLIDNKYSTDELKAIGAKLGADIPFCIEGGTQLVEGIGDIMTQTAPAPKVPLVIAKMGEGMSTPTAYKALDLKYNSFNNYSINSEKLSILTDGSNKCLTDYSQGLYNIFESVVEPERRCVTLIKEAMISHGALNALMSGSGTSVFGIFENEQAAMLAVNQLKALGAVAHLAYPSDVGISII